MGYLRNKIKQVELGLKMAESGNEWTALLKMVLQFGLHKISVNYWDNQGYDADMSSHYTYFSNKNLWIINTRNKI